MKNLKDQQCTPCESGALPLKGGVLAELGSKLGASWLIVDEHHIEKEYKFKNFQDALAFVNKVGSIAEQQGHHPDISLSWGRVKLSIWTHKIKGLTESDFILAAKCDEVL